MTSVRGAKLVGWVSLLGVIAGAGLTSGCLEGDPLTPEIINAANAAYFNGQLAGAPAAAPGMPAAPPVGAAPATPATAAPTFATPVSTSPELPAPDFLAGEINNVVDQVGSDEAGAEDEDAIPTNALTLQEWLASASH